jgi:phosphohistidine phosphatase
VKTLHLLRHAKSDWADDSLPDQERPLAPRGIKAARQLAQHLEANPIEVDLVLCSPARRTRETLELLRPALGSVAVKFDQTIYAAAGEELLTRLRRVSKNVGAVMIIGHNPGVEEAAWLLLGPGRAPGHFPTCALAGLRLPAAGWKEVEEGTADLVAFLTPKDL